MGLLIVVLLSVTALACGGDDDEIGDGGSSAIDSGGAADDDSADESPHGAAADVGNGGGLPDPCAVVAPDVVGSGVTFDGPFDDAGNTAEGPFPDDTATDLACTWVGAESSGTIAVDTSSDFDSFCTVGMGGEVVDRRCITPDLSTTSAATAVAVDSLQFHLLATGPGADAAVDAVANVLLAG